MPRTPLVLLASRRHSLRLALLALAAAAIGLVSIQATPAGASVATVVSLTFDDGAGSQWQARDILAAHGVHGTFYVNSGRIGASGYMTQSQLLALQSDGNEIGGHTVTHADLPTLDLGEMQRQICNDRVTLLNRGFNVTSLAYPYGDFDARAEQVAQDCGYNSARAVGGIHSPGVCLRCPYAERMPPADLWAAATPDSVKTDTTVEDLQSVVLGAESHGGGWLPIVMHHVCAGSGCDTLSVSPEVLSAFLDWLIARRDQGTVVATVQDVISGTVKPGVAGPVAPPPSSRELLQNTSLEMATLNVPDCWTLGGYGNNSSAWSWTSLAPHSGAYAEQVQISFYGDGDRKLISRQDLGSCAPPVTSGRTYVLRGSYKSSAAVRPVAYTRGSSGGWAFWTQAASTLPAASSWTQFTWTTPVVPGGAEAISVGASLRAVGTMTLDDLSLTDTDQLPPSVDLTAPAEGARVRGTVALTAAASDPSGIARVEFLVNGQAVGTDATAPYSYDWDSAAAGDASVSITARAKDVAGNVATAMSHLVTVANTDSLAPQSTIACDGGSCGEWHSAPVSVAFAATDDDSGVAGIYFTTDGTDPSDASARYTAPFSVGAATTLRWRAIDRAGNAETIHAHELRFETTPPSSSIACADVACGDWHSAPVSVTLSAHDDEAGVDAIRYTTDGSDPGPDSPRYAGPFAVSTTTTVKFRGYDSAGNVEAVQASALRFETVAPRTAATCNGGPCEGAWATGPVTVALTATDADSGIESIRYTRDGSLPTAASARYTEPLVATGAETIRYRAYDVAGNAEQPQSLEVPIDDTPPATFARCNGAACEPWYTASATVELTASDGQSGVQAIRYTTDGSVPGTGSAAYTGPIVVDGTTTLRYRAYDATGNAEAPRTLAIGIDRNAPASTITCNDAPCSAGPYSAPVTVKLSATDAESGTAVIRYTTDGSDPTGAAVAYQGPFVISASATVKFRAFDNAGNAEAVNARTIAGPGANLLVNPSLEADSDRDAIADCWAHGGFGTNAVTWSRIGDAHLGSFAEQMQVTSLKDGNVKLFSKQDTGTCAPAAIAGHAYRVSAWYRATAQPRLVAYYRTSSGWVWWAQSALLPVSSGYVQASWSTPAFPSGATLISIAVSLDRVGTLTMDDLSITDLG